MGRTHHRMLRVDGKDLDSVFDGNFLSDMVSECRELNLSSALAIESLSCADALRCCNPMEESLTLCSAYWDGGCLQREQVQVGLQGSVS